MATITNLTSGIEVDFAGAVTYIKHGNVKLLKRGTNINIYDDSDDDGNQRGQVYISIPFSEVTSPVTANIDALYTAVKGYIDVSSGGGGGTDANAVHVNVGSEISVITAKATPTASDILLIEDAADSNNKKKITIGDIPSSGSASPLTTKGDLYSFDTDNARLPIGTDGQILVADSNESTGLKWQGNNTIGTKVIVQGRMDTTQGFTSTAERIDYVDNSTGGFDVNGEWDNTTHRFTVDSSGAGVYSFTNTLFINNAGGWIQIFIKKNGVTQRITGTDLASSWDTPIGTTNIELVVGDYVEFWADSTTSFTMDATWYALNNFQITKIGDSVTIYNAPAEPRIVSVASTATLSISSSATDQSIITAQAEALTIAAPTGTPVEGQKVIVRIKDDGSARGITFNAIFRAIGVTLPTTTVASKITYLGLVYNSTDTKWDIVATKTEA